MCSAIHIIMYHYVRELTLTRYPAIRGLLLSQFHRQLDYLTENGYTFVSARQVLAQMRGEITLPGKSVLLTFDDGYADHYTNVFPLLEQRGIPAFFSMPGKIIAEHKLLDVNKIHFLLASRSTKELVPAVFAQLDHYRSTEFPIPSNEVLYEKLAVASRFDDKDTIFIKRLLQVELEERLRNRITDELFCRFVSDNEEAFANELYLSLDQVRTMARHGMEWGIHGYDHYWMNRLKEDALRQDILRAKEVFDGVLPDDGWICCYPYGSVSDDVVRMASELGAVGGITTEVRALHPDKDDIFRMPRWDTNDVPPKSMRFLEQ